MSVQADFGEKYFCKENPNQSSKFSYLIFDWEANLHLPLTSFSTYLKERYASNTIRSYIHEVISFFSWYHNKESYNNRKFWEKEPEQIRSLLSDYLITRLKCQIRNKGTYTLIYITSGSPKTISILLAALRCFYNSAILNKFYKFKNPLIGISLKLDETEDFSRKQSNYPIMPHISGVTEIKKNKRLTDAYFILTQNEWTPYIVNDKNLPNQVFNAGKLVGWKIRQNLITILLFETGARISEVCGLTLGDWYDRGLDNEASSFSKGSFQRRVKFLRWSNNTTKSLKYYFDNERIKFDKNGLKLLDYINLARQKKIDLYSVYIFITNHGTPLKPNVYRDLYWLPACKKAKLKINIHQIRHWYVSTVIEEIHSLKLTKDEYELKVGELIKYMNWKSGRQTLEVYEHFFQKMEHQLLQDTLHAKLDGLLKNSIDNADNLKEFSIIKNSNDYKEITEDPELDFLWGLGGDSYEN
ncbi:site-specific integrase [Acinetobacter haemolyticus]|nr:site-specific integrase [Acinetobacter haemolyticus]